MHYSNLETEVDAYGELFNYMLLHQHWANRLRLTLPDQLPELIKIFHTEYREWRKKVKERWVYIQVIAAAGE